MSNKTVIIKGDNSPVSRNEMQRAAEEILNHPTGQGIIFCGRPGKLCIISNTPMIELSLEDAKRVCAGMATAIAELEKAGKAP